MTKIYFGQDNPSDQLKVIAGSLEGHALNLEDGFEVGDLAKVLKHHVTLLRALAEQVQGVPWKESDDVSFLRGRSVNADDESTRPGIREPQGSSVDASDEGADLTCPNCGAEVFDVEDFCENCDDDYRGSFAEAADNEGARIAAGDYD